MTKGLEIISTVERRRRWTAEEKVAILDQALRPGGSIAAAADRNDVSRSLIYLWRKQARAGSMPGVALNSEAAAKFVPVRLAGPQARSTGADGPSARPCRCCAAVIEIVLSNGRVIKTVDGIDPDVLARYVAALDGERS